MREVGQGREPQPPEAAVRAPAGQMPIGTRVSYTGPDFRFVGEVRGHFTKRDGSARYVVENGDGLTRNFKPGQLELI